MPKFRVYQASSGFAHAECYDYTAEPIEAKTALDAIKQVAENEIEHDGSSWRAYPVSSEVAYCSEAQLKFKVQK